MKNIKASSLIIFLGYILVVTAVMTRYPQALSVLAVIMSLLFLFSAIVRGNFKFKPYFTSKYNIFTSKIRHQKEFDLPKDILFDKMAEVLSEAGFTMRHIDKVSGHLFATAKTTIWSWGENIYIEIREVNGFTSVDFCSVCFFGIISWGKNERNYERMMDTFENSLII